MKVRLDQIVQARWFHRTITAVILLAGVLTGLETSATIRERHGAWLHALDRLVLLIFVAEMGLKIGAHGRQPWRYFRDGWNVFDFTIVVLCLLPAESPFAAVLRLARGLRLLRLVTALPRLQLLVGALLKSLGAMGYVGLLLALMFYIYGVAGVHLFGRTDEVHFGSLPAALFSLFQVITLDNWSDIFRATQVGAPAGAVIYFVSFILLGTMIMLNLFIGIIMNSMAETHEELEPRDRSPGEPGTGHTTLADELEALDRQLDQLKRQTDRLRHRLRDASAPPMTEANGPAVIAHSTSALRIP